MVFLKITDASGAAFYFVGVSTDAILKQADVIVGIEYTHLEITEADARALNLGLIDKGIESVKKSQEDQRSEAFLLAKPATEKVTRQAARM